MLLSDFQKYQDQYEPGAKKIISRVSRPKLTKEENPILKMEMSYDNYDLLFSKKGVLISSIHFDRRGISKTSYSYNRSEKLVCATKTNMLNFQLIELNEFEYDQLGRIIQQTCKMLYETGIEPWIYVQKHEYGINTETIYMTSNIIDEEDHLIFDTYDENENLIESKVMRNEEELVYWLKWEYDSNGEIVKEISLEENSEIIINEANSENENIEVKEYARELSQSKSVINEVKLRNEEPTFYYEKTIEFYGKG